MAGRYPFVIVIKPLLTFRITGLVINVKSKCKFVSMHEELSHDTLHAYVLVIGFKNNIERTIGHFVSNIQFRQNCIKVDFKNGNIIF